MEKGKLRKETCKRPRPLILRPHPHSKPLPLIQRLHPLILRPAPSYHGLTL